MFTQRSLIFLAVLIATASVSSAADAETAIAAKPWLDNPAAYFNDHPDRQWIIGHSDVACLSAAEANDSACRDAARQIALLYAGNAHAERHESISRDRFAKRVLAELVAGRFVHDRYFASVKKPYGELWTAAVLVDASDDALRRLAAGDVAAERARRVAGVFRGALLAGLCVVILLVYAGLNAVTRGYFQSRLRFAAVVCMLGVVLMMRIG